MNQFLYVVLADQRERPDHPVLLITSDYNKALSKARSYLIGHNKDLFPRFILDKNLSDREFLNKYDNGWQVAASIIRKKLS